MTRQNSLAVSVILSISVFSCILLSFHSFLNCLKGKTLEKIGDRNKKFMIVKKGTSPNTHYKKVTPNRVGEELKNTKLDANWE